MICSYDSGSMYGNTHCCGKPASHVVTHSAGSGPAMQSPVCTGHRSSMMGRYPFPSTTSREV